MPSVQVYVRTIINETTSKPSIMWKDVSASYSSHADETGLVLYGEGCVYIFYKLGSGGGSPAYAMTGDYKIVVVK